MMKIRRYIVLVAALLLMGQGASAWNGSGTEQSPYEIANETDWNQLADNVNAGTDYQGTYFRKTDDFTITTMVGGADHVDGGALKDETFRTFNGIYDGNGKTLILNLDVTGERYVGPFHCVSGATIKNLKVTGSVQVHEGTKGASSIHHPSALIGC